MLTLEESVLHQKLSTSCTGWPQNVTNQKRVHCFAFINICTVVTIALVTDRYAIRFLDIRRLISECETFKIFPNLHNLVSYIETFILTRRIDTFKYCLSQYVRCDTREAIGTHWISSDDPHSIIRYQGLSHCFKSDVTIPKSVWQ